MTNFSLTPPATQFIDGGWSTLARVLPFMEGNTSFNALNFNVDYNEATGMNYTGCSTTLAVFVCPSATHSPDGLRDGIDPYDPASNFNGGYGYGDYGATNYTDIDPLGQTTYATNYPATPFRNKYSAPTACSTRVRPGSPRSPMARAIRSPSARMPAAIPVIIARTPKAITTGSTPGLSSAWGRPD